jgi:hypothetical protein
MIEFGAFCASQPSTKLLHPMLIPLKGAVGGTAVVPVCHDQPLGHQLGSATVGAFEIGLLGTTVSFAVNFGHE